MPNYDAHWPIGAASGGTYALYMGYLRGVREDRPAVISVNMFFASLMVQEFLARLHPFRNQMNTAYAAVRANLLEPFLITESDGAPCAVFERHVGRGDVEPLLDRPDLS